MKVGIFYNAQQVEFAVAKKLANLLQEKEAQPMLFTSLEEISGIDRLIVLGGDGTLLRAARYASDAGIPLVGVNFGRLGFLTEFEREEAEQAVSLVLDDTCETLHRSMLEVNLNGMRTQCLNELSMLRPINEAGDIKVVRISIAIDGSSAGEIAADGLIVTTPTGSTAYSLSAGGCIMTPDCESFLLTPVCAFSMRSRPIACSDRSTISFTVEKDASLMLFGDGIFLGSVGADDSLTVRKSERFATFLTRDKRGFFRRVTTKINKGKRLC